MYTIQSLQEHADPLTIQPQHIEEVASAAPEDTEMPRERMLLQHGFDLRRERRAAASLTRVLAGTGLKPTTLGSDVPRL